MSAIAAPVKLIDLLVIETKVFLCDNRNCQFPNVA